MRTLKLIFLWLLSESEIFSLNYTVQYGKKNLFIKKNLFHMQSTILYSLGFAFNLVLFFVITIIKTYIENIATERHPCNRKVFLVIKLPQNEIF